MDQRFAIVALARPALQERLDRVLAYADQLGKDPIIVKDSPGFASSRLGVLLGLENHDFVRNIDYLLRILKAIDSKWLGVIWDSANLAPTPDPYADLARIAPYAIVAQVKVMTRVNGKEVPADYARLVKILRDARYRGYLVFEYEEREDPYKAIPGHLASLRKLITKP